MFTSDTLGYINTSYWQQDFYACGFVEGGGIKTNAGIPNTKASNSLIEFIMLFMLVMYIIE
ncbi:CPA_1a_G0028130.mRNA.1.CDS.1 [Saccharomyces cerevisiae]|nr:CPA_1a_G0028130.mRNA.1.CDS.1 [Saccharomyces cerevisiae]CAI4537287.1 BBM_1a_G0027700.mRNA.1.CDS.1 [Saccharomyces cerevisiae]CAI7162603.1 BBM_1a_G0027700.mRNA.1.CDS.1 [Saccharomyces cerevisiae]CAI7347279.1 CPA_1a_G0028130.mRNA.1.CDS.1 [Saccharomyces cerevisiae]